MKGEVCKLSASSGFHLENAGHLLRPLAAIETWEVITFKIMAEASVFLCSWIC